MVYRFRIIQDPGSLNEYSRSLFFCRLWAMISKRKDLQDYIGLLSGSQSQGSSTGELRLQLLRGKPLSEGRHSCGSSFKKTLMGVKVHCTGRSWGGILFTGRFPTLMVAPRSKVCSDIVERPPTRVHFLGYSVSLLSIIKDDMLRVHRSVFPR